jgi:hypothetical protein
MFNEGDLVQYNKRIYILVETQHHKCLLCDPNSYDKLTTYYYQHNSLINLIENVSPYTLGFINTYGDECRLFGILVKLALINNIKEVPLLKKVLYE